MKLFNLQLRLLIQNFTKIADLIVKYMAKVLLQYPNLFLIEVKLLKLLNFLKTFLSFVSLICFLFLILKYLNLYLQAYLLILISQYVIHLY